MTFIRCLIIDDEPLGRNELSHLLSVYPDIEIIGKASSGEEGLTLTIKLQPDVLFLDIEMAMMNGIELVHALQQLKKVPLIVFATAYSEYAVTAFRLQVLDYLLKPFDAKQLHETIERIRDAFQQTEALDQTVTSPRELFSKLAVEDEEGITYIDPQDIQYCVKEGKDTHVCTKKRTYTSRITLKELEEKLVDHPFFRVHKSYLVNLKRISALVPWFNGAYQIKIEGTQKEIPVSRNYVKGLRKHLEL